MIKTCLLLLLFSTLTIARINSLKRSAVFDIKQISLTMNQTQSFQLKDMKKNHAFMINLQENSKERIVKDTQQIKKQEIKKNRILQQSKTKSTTESQSQKLIEQNQQTQIKETQISYKAPTPVGLQIRITKSDNQTTTCDFKYSNNLCVLEKPSHTLVVTVICTAQHCNSHSLIFSQRQIIDFSVRNLMSSQNKNTKLLNDPGAIYKLQHRKFNSILQIFSQRQKYVILSSEIKIFSNVHVFNLDKVEQLQANNALFGIKPIKTGNDQYFYIENTRIMSAQHLKFNIKSYNGEVNQANPIVDFIQNYGNNSKNLYVYNAPLKNDLQAKFRIFSPHNPKNLHFVLRVLAKVEWKHEPTVIGQLKFDPIQFDGVKLYDFSYIIPKSIHGKFKMVWFETYLSQGSDRSLFFQLEVRDLETLQISILEDVFFNANQNQKLKFVVEPQLKLQIEENDKDIKLLTNSSQNYFSSTSTCSLHKGCEIVITAEKKCFGCSFRFNLDNEDIKNGIIFYEVKQDAIQGRIDLDQIIYFKYTLKAKGTVEIVANSINIIMYAILNDYKQCKIPTTLCQQYVINHQSPTYIQNKEKDDKVIIIALHGLQKTFFTVRFLEKHNGINLSLGQKFTYLLDDDQNSMILKFKIPKQGLNKESQHLIFNLLSPINSLILTVENSNGRKLNSTSGYIIFQKTEIVDNEFQIKIQKMRQYLQQYVHFTFIISTNDIAVRLDSTITHYQRYLPSTSRTFIIEFDPDVKSALNIYTQNLEKQQGYFLVSLKIVQDDDDQTQQKNVNLPAIRIVRDYQFLSLDELMSTNDACEDMNCEIQITFTYKGNTSIDQAITLFSSQSIINLYDSLWNVFSINQLSKTNHFYFIPRNQNQSIHILFNTEDPNLFISYRIHNTQNSFNPQDWPFQTRVPQNQLDLLGNRDISISNDDPQLKKCKPYCAILINVHETKKQKNSKKVANQLIKSYKILATNNIIQLPQDTKLSFTLFQEQKISLFILLHNFRQSQQFTFFTSFTVGNGLISASIMDNSKQFGLTHDNKHFRFQGLQNQITIESIDQALQKNHASWNSSMLKITVQAESDLKLNLQFTSQMKEIYKLSLGELELVNLYTDQQTIYEFIPQRDFNLKLYRIHGVPMYKLVKCIEKDYLSCVSFIKKLKTLAVKYFQQNKQNLKKISINSNKKDTQTQNNTDATASIQQNNDIDLLMQKTFQYAEQSCQDCIYFLWMYCFQDFFEVSVNLRTIDTETQLKQLIAVDDRLQFKDMSHKYLMNLIPQKDAYINVRLLGGSISVQVKGEKQSILYSKKMNSSQDYADISIPGIQSQDKGTEEDDQSDSQAEGEGEVLQQKRNVFRKIHMKVISTSKQIADYIISYSNSMRGQYIEDGIILEKHLLPEIPYTFYYKTRNKKTNPILTLTSQLDEDMAQNENKGQNLLVPRFYYYPNINNKDLKEEFKPEMPPKRNQNYLGKTISHVYQLPAKFDLFQIEIVSKLYIKATISISHQELVYVPLDYQYIVRLAPKQKISMVVENPKKSFLKVSIKKCDDTLPSLKFTNSALQFKKGNFQSFLDLQNDQITQYIKTGKDHGPIYLMFTGDEIESSIMNVNVKGTDKINKNEGGGRFKPGNAGIITYQIMNTNNVQIDFKPVSCNGKPCSLVQYFLIIGDKIDDIYSQINCAASFFVPQAKRIQGTQKSQIISIKNESYNPKTQSFIYNIKLSDTQEYIGVRAVITQNDEDKDVNYVPIQITSIWRQLSKISLGIFIMIAIFFSLFITIVIVISTKMARKGYRPISSNQ